MNSSLNVSKVSLALALSISLLLHVSIVIWFFQFEKKFLRSSTPTPHSSRISISISSDLLTEDAFSVSSKSSAKHSEPDTQSPTKQSNNVASEDISYQALHSSDPNNGMKSNSRPTINKFTPKNSTRDINSIDNNSSPELELPLSSLSENINDAKSSFPASEGSWNSDQKPRYRANDHSQASTASQAGLNVHDKLSQPNNVKGLTPGSNDKSNAETNGTDSSSINPNLKTSKTSNEVVINQLPKCKRCIEPKYPRSALRSGYEGTVEVRVLISTSGRVFNANLIRSSGDRSLDKAALNAAMSSTFYPLKNDSSRIIHYEMTIKN